MTSPSLVRPAAAGAAAGIAGGVVFGAAMASLGTLPTVASIVRSDSVAVGLAVHMGIAATVGAGSGCSSRTSTCGAARRCSGG